MNNTNKVFAQPWKNYELIDAGGGKKLERWGSVVTIRPERQAYFKSGEPHSKWNKMADWEFEEKDKNKGVWKPLKPDALDQWAVNYKNLQFNLSITNFKHLGLFPEQVYNWSFIYENLQTDKRMLNLFAYTGAASVVGRSSGAEVVHVDAVKPMITWARENMESSGLDGIKWVVEDAITFAKREVKRGNHYDLMIMDPPAWGLGTKKQKWKLEQQLPQLIDLAYQLLNPKGSMILNTYSPRVTLDEVKDIVALYFGDKNTEAYELWMKTTTNKELFFGQVVRANKKA